MPSSALTEGSKLTPFTRVPFRCARNSTMLGLMTASVTPRGYRFIEARSTVTNWNPVQTDDVHSSAVKGWRQKRRWRGTGLGTGHLGSGDWMRDRLSMADMGSDDGPGSVFLPRAASWGLHAGTRPAVIGR